RSGRPSFPYTTLFRSVRPGTDDAAALTLGQARWLLESLPVKRRSRLQPVLERLVAAPAQLIERPSPALELPRSDAMALAAEPALDRKSTRLNSSHVKI